VAGGHRSRREAPLTTPGRPEECGEEGMAAARALAVGPMAAFVRTLSRSESSRPPELVTVCSCWMSGGVTGDERFRTPANETETETERPAVIPVLQRIKECP
jgi:hypothetical protein